MEKINNDKIEQYLRSELNDDDVRKLELKLKQDPSFAQEFNMLKAIFLAAQNLDNIELAEEQLELENLIGDIENDLEQKGFFQKKKKIKPNRRSLTIFIGVLAIAASITIILFFPVFENEDKDPFAELPSSQLNINAFAVEGMQLLGEGMIAYGQKNFEEAASKLEAYIQKSNVPLPNYKKEAQFYLALSLAKKGNLIKARKYLEYLLEVGNFPLIEETKWYLAKIYQVNGNEKAAIELWLLLVDNPIYGKQAKKLLNQHK